MTTSRKPRRLHQAALRPLTPDQLRLAAGGGDRYAYYYGGYWYAEPYWK